MHKQVYIYGSLDRGPTELIRSYGMAWGIGGWLLTPFLQKAGLARVAQLRDQVAAGLATTFASSYTAQDRCRGYRMQPNGQPAAVGRRTRLARGLVGPGRAGASRTEARHDAGTMGGRMPATSQSADTMYRARGWTPR